MHARLPAAIPCQGPQRTGYCECRHVPGWPGMEVQLPVPRHRAAALAAGGVNEGGQASAVFFGHGESFGSRLAATHLSWSCAGSGINACWRGTLHGRAVLLVGRGWCGEFHTPTRCYSLAAPAACARPPGADRLLRAVATPASLVGHEWCTLHPAWYWEGSDHLHKLVLCGKPPAAIRQEERL